MTSSLTKTQGTSLIAWADVATGNVSVSGAEDVSTKFAATVFAWLGRDPAAGAFTTGWPNIRIEASADSSGDDTWIPVVVFQPGLGVNLANTTLNGAAGVGDNHVHTHANTNLAAGDLIFLGHTTTPSDYEIARVISVTGAGDPYTVNLEEVTANAHDNAAVVTDQAELFIAQIDLTGVGRIRAVVDNANSGRTIAVRVLMVTGDSIG